MLIGVITIIVIVIIYKFIKERETLPITILQKIKTWRKNNVLDILILLVLIRKHFMKHNSDITDLDSCLLMGHITNKHALAKTLEESIKLLADQNKGRYALFEAFCIWRRTFEMYNNKYILNDMRLIYYELFNVFENTDKHDFSFQEEIMSKLFNLFVSTVPSVTIDDIVEFKQRIDVMFFENDGVLPKSKA